MQNSHTPRSKENAGHRSRATFWAENLSSLKMLAMPKKPPFALPIIYHATIIRYTMVNFLPQYQSLVLATC
jgi:hypothetical protein